MRKHINRIISATLAAAMSVSMISSVTASAEETIAFPYTLFAASEAEGAITTTAGNFCVNGNVATNGTIASSGNMNVNGTKNENAGLEMIYIFDKIDTKYFSGNNVEEHTEDYFLDELNININTPTEVLGKAELTGNININTALKAFEDITLNGEVKNTNNSVIFSKYGDIVIDSANVNLNGLVYAPFGSVEVKAMNLNLNNVVIIADSIVLDCPNVNANYSTNAADFVGTVSEPLNIPKDEWQYMKDENENGLPDFFEDFDREQFRKTIERLGLNEEMKASAMSSGMNAKLKAAATLARKADLILLDEPLNGVDYKAREEIIALILEEADENRTMVISTHLIEEVESFIEDAIFIKDGHLVDVVNVETERMTTGNSLAELYLQKM